jgi:hypothetical protein
LAFISAPSLGCSDDREPSAKHVLYRKPGATTTHNPFVDVTKDTTTLHASDCHVFLFLVDDTHPIEAGRLPEVGGRGGFPGDQHPAQ